MNSTRRVDSSTYSVHLRVLSERKTRNDSVISIFIFSVPFLAIALANIFLNEPFSLNIIIGGTISLLAIYIVNRK